MFGFLVFGLRLLVGFSFWFCVLGTGCWGSWLFDVLVVWCLCFVCFWFCVVRLFGVMVVGYCMLSFVFCFVVCWLWFSYFGFRFKVERVE